MTEATSPLLNRPLRTQAEVLRAREIRDEEMQGGSIDSAQDQADELDFLADKVEELRLKFLSTKHYSEAIKFGCDVLYDLISDLRGTAQRIEEEERNNR